jgi:hypothetical protein
VSVASYPLTWPQGFPRTPRERRESGKFRTSYADALKNVPSGSNDKMAELSAARDAALREIGG